MAEKILNARFQLRHDTLANWTTENPELKRGEIAVATIDTVNPANKLNPPVMFKVGPGNFNSLDWASALAADVYSWAKEANLPVDTTAITDGMYVTGLEWKNNKLYVTTAELVTDIATNGTSKKAATTAAVKAYVDDAIADVVAQGTVVAAGDLIDVVQEGNVYTVSHETVAAPTETAGSGRKYLTGVTTDGYGHITGFTTATEAEEDFGVLSVTGENAIKVDNTDEQNPVVSLALNNTGNVKFTQDDNGLKGDVARVADADHADAATKVDNALTVKVGGETKTFDGSAAIEADVDAAITAAIEAEGHPEYSIVKDTTSEYAATYHLTKDGVNVGAAINIPKDLVVESGKVETLEAGVWGEAGTYIVLTLANATNDKIYVNVGSLIEYVTSGSTTNDQVIVNIDDNHKVTATIGAGKVGTTELADKAVTAAKLNADVDTHVNVLIDEKINALDVNNITGLGAGKTLATLTETDGKIAATFQDIAITESQITDLKEYALKSELPIIAADEEYLTAQKTNDTTTTISLKQEVAGRLMSALQQVSIHEDSTDYLISDNADNVATLAFTEKTKTSLDKADTAVQNVTTGTGLKATRAEGSNDVTINIDDTVVFVFDGGDAFGDPLNA